MLFGSARCVLVLFIGSLVASPPHLSVARLSSSDTAVIEELYHLWFSKADGVWATAARAPIPVIYIKSDFEYAIGFPQPIEGFTPVSSGTELQRSVQVRTRTFATDLSASFSVAGIPAVVVASPDLQKKSPEEWVIVAEHEMFHVFQAANGSEAKMATLAIGSREAGWQLTFPFPYTDPNVMQLIHLQGYNLWLAASNKDDDEAKYDVGTALDSVDVYRTLLQRLHEPKDYLYSELQEWSEGVAKYTEYRFAECAAQGDYVPASSFRTLPGYKGYADLWQTNYQNLPYLVKHAGRAARSRDAFYHLGMGKALALDRVYPEWKKRYFDNGIWLDDLLRLAVTRR